MRHRLCVIRGNQTDSCQARGLERTLRSPTFALGTKGLLRFVQRALCCLLLLGAASGLSGCAAVRPIPGTKIPDTPMHREVLARVEEYRLALEQRDSNKLLSMASPNYYEDSGTPSAADDYGFAGLKKILDARLGALRWLRYLIRYRDVRVEGGRAFVDVRYDISFQLMTELGERWERKQSEKRIELVRDDNRWLFISGM